MSLLDCFPSLGSFISATASQPTPVDLLLLGSGWTSTFLLPQAAEAGLKVASTTRDGRGGTIKWTFDPDANGDDLESYRSLPDAKTILIVFPLYTEQSVKSLVAGYLRSRGGQEEKLSVEDVQTRFILLGSTGIYNNGPTLSLAPLEPPGSDFQMEKKKPHPPHKPHDPPEKPAPTGPWRDNDSEVMPMPRALAENYLLDLAKPNNAIRTAPIPTTVLLLCGLWGHGRSVRHFIPRLPANKAAFRNLGSIQMIHGRDVARAVIAMQGAFEKAYGKRWILTNNRVYDLWDLASQFGSAGDAGRDHPPTGPFPALVHELINEPDCPARSLPRSAETMYEMTGGTSLALDGRQFWNTFGLTPEVPWVD